MLVGLVRLRAKRCTEKKTGYLQSGEPSPSPRAWWWPGSGSLGLGPTRSQSAGSSSAERELPPQSKWVQ